MRPVGSVGPRSDPRRRVRDRLWRALLGPGWGAPDEVRLRGSLTGRRVLVTGASSGIGAATARRLADAGARVVLTGRDTARLAAVAADLPPGTAEVVPADLTARDDVDRLAATVLAAGPLDIVVSNAGRSIHRAASIERADDLDRSIAVNLLGPARLLLALVPRMASGGHVVHVGSVSVDVPAPGWSAYTASKTAADAWLRCVAPEWRRRGITVSSVRFPLVHTPMSAPTYQRAPGLTASAAADVIAGAIVSRRRLVAPWYGRLAGAALRTAPATGEALLARLVPLPAGSR